MHGMDKPMLPPLSDDDCYRALHARDARFDGRFFTGVSSTGVYCRPVCKVKTPLRQNCHFFLLAAQAEGAGFRPCLRCRPELAPGSSPAWTTQDASAVLSAQAARWLDAPRAAGAQAPTVSALAQRLGISDRHLRRIFESHYGISPLQYLQTRRLLNAKQLLSDTRLPVVQVALASGFASLRRFNAAFTQHYGLAPSQLRRAGTANSPANTKGMVIRLGYRPPLDVQAMLNFWQARQIQGLESVQGQRWLRVISLPSSTGLLHGWLAIEFDTAQHQAVLQASDSLRAAMPQLIWRARQVLDLDADPQAIHAILGPSFPQGAGLRVPGAWDGFELAVRAVLGQQITVAAARTLCSRLVARYGPKLDTPWPELSRAFPSAATLAEAAPADLGALGIVRQRQAAIVALAQAVASGRLVLEPQADLNQTLAQLLALPGIGPWSAQYIAMRALRWPDAFPASDVALHNALGLRDHKNPTRAAEAASQAWRPWRSYAVIRVWTQGAAATPLADSAASPLATPA